MFGTSSGGNSKARLPGEDFSKIRPSFWFVWREAFLILRFKSYPSFLFTMAVRARALKRRPIFLCQRALLFLLRRPARAWLAPGMRCQAPRDRRFSRGAIASSRFLRSAGTPA